MNFKINNNLNKIIKKQFNYLNKIILMNQKNYNNDIMNEIILKNLILNK